MTDDPVEWMNTHESGWKTWAFGEDLRLEETEPSKPSGATRRERALTEEGLETLLMLNLDRLFPNLALRLSRKQLHDWSGADIRAVDPTGQRHVFELKHEASARDAVDQAIAYGFQALNERGFAWFDEQPDRDLIAAARIQGFWNGERIQNFSLPEPEKHFAPTHRTKAILDRLSGEKLTMNDWRSRYSKIIEGLEPEPAWMRNADSEAFNLAGTHLHLVVPYAESLHDYSIESLERLRSRGLFVTVWEAAVEVTRDGSNGGEPHGQLWLRRAEILSDNEEAPDSEDPAGSPETKREPSPWSITVENLFAQMALQDSGLEVLRSDWEHHPSGYSGTVDWQTSDYEQSLRFALWRNGTNVICEIRTNRTGWRWNHPDPDTRTAFRQRIRKRRKYIGHWLRSVVNLEDIGEGGFSVSSNGKWAPEDRVTTEHDGWARTVRHGLPARAYHPTGLLAARFAIDTAKHPLPIVSDVCADALASFREIAATARYDEEAFGPFEEVPPEGPKDSAANPFTSA